jgi:hypothetical protein
MRCALDVRQFSHERLARLRDICALQPRVLDLVLDQHADL